MTTRTARAITRKPASGATTRTRSAIISGKATVQKSPSKAIKPVNAKKGKSVSGEIILATPKLDKVFAAIQKNYGKHCVRSLHEMLPITYISSGIFSLDYCTLGGIPDHYLTQYYGWESSGKTTDALLAAVKAQIKYPDKIVVFVDVETHFDEQWALALGVDPARFKVLSDAGLGETYADALDAILSTGDVSLVIFDSLLALITKDTADKSAYDPLKIAGRAAVVASLCASIALNRQLSFKADLHIPAVIFINQYRNKAGFHMGSDLALPGGNYPKFLAKLNVQHNKPQVLLLGQGKGAIKEGDDEDAGFAVMNKSTFKIDKSKIGLSHTKGSYKFVRSDAHPRLKAGQVEESDAVVKMAKVHGFLTGHTTNQKLTVFGDGVKGTAGQLAIELENHPPACDLLKAAIVGKVRSRVGKPVIPYDNMLMGVSGDDVIHLISQSIYNGGSR